MSDPSSQNLEMWVLETIRGGFKSIEVLDAERPPHAPPYNEDRALLQNFTTTVSRQGKVLARLSVVSETRAELLERMPGLANRVPTWLDAHLEGRPTTWEIFMQGIAEMMAEHREAIEMVIEEQMSDPKEIEEVLADAPVPAGINEETRDELFAGVFQVLTAHTKALAGIACDLEMQVGGIISPDFEVYFGYQ
ncbi:MAG TPA: hypothetical protein VGC63_12750 [Solirubrobacterales bacterium]|jgi:hypothetical protein